MKYQIPLTRNLGIFNPKIDQYSMCNIYEKKGLPSKLMLTKIQEKRQPLEKVVCKQAHSSIICKKLLVEDFGLIDVSEEFCEFYC